MAETLDEAVQEIKDYIDVQKADMLSKMNTKFETVKDFLHRAIKEGKLIIETPTTVKSRKKRYQN